MKFKDTDIDFATPKIMGIINMTPDSFYDGGKIKDDSTLLAQTERMLGEGADFLDVGGYSSRPGADFVSVEEERRRVIPTIELLVKNFPEAVISIDTFSAAIASEAIAAGSAFINDISSGDDDPQMFETVARLKVPYVAMHKRGSPKTMQAKPTYTDPISEIFEYLSNKLKALHVLGVHDVIIDPGFGFGKTREHNYMLLKQLNRFKALGVPLLVGLSRKSMIQKVVSAPADEALSGTIAANTVALLNGADILRVHDVAAARQAVAIVSELGKLS